MDSHATPTGLRLASRVAFRRFIPAAALAILSILVALSGFLRDAIAASIFGTGQALDAYVVAYFILRTFDDPYQVAVTGALLPIFVRLLAQDGRAKAHAFATAIRVRVTRSTVLVVSLATTASLTLATLFERAAWPGAMILALAAVLFWVLPSHLAHASIRVPLDTESHYWASPTSRLAYSLLPIPFMYLLHDRLGIFAVAWGLVGGAALQLAIQHRIYRRIAPPSDAILRSDDLPTKPLWRDVHLIFLAGLVAMSSGLLDRLGATALREGSASAFHFARALVDVYVLLLPTTAATLLLPSVSALLGSHGPAAVVRRTAAVCAVVAASGAAAAVPLTIYREEIVVLVFQRGAFDALSSTMTATVLGALAPALPVLGLHVVLAMALKALGANRALFLAYATGTLAKACAIIPLARTFGSTGIAWANIACELIWVVALALALWMALRRNVATVNN